MHAELTPFNQMWWYLRLGYYEQMVGNYAAAQRALDSAIELSEGHGFLRRTFLLIVSYQIALAASVHDAQMARHWYARMVEMADTTRPMDRWHVAQSKAHVDCIEANYKAVAEIGEKAAEIAMSAGMSYIEILTVEHWATGRAVLGDLEGFTRAIQRLRSLSQDTCFSYFECAARLLESYVALEHGDRSEGTKRAVERGIGILRSTTFPVSADGSLFGRAAGAAGTSLSDKRQAQLCSGSDTPLQVTRPFVCD
jgi:hypothetical protein